MTKENENQSQDEKLLSFPLNLLSGLTSFDTERFQKMHNFFKNAFVDLSASEFFDDKEYREEWQENLMYLENMAIPYKDYSFEEIQTAIGIAVKVLDKNKSEVLSQELK